MRTKYLPVAMAFIACYLSAVTTYADAQKPNASSVAQVKIERAAAEKTALQQVPGGVIKEGELERENGRLVWSFDVQQLKSLNIIEVQVDAISGKVVSVVTETPADQAKEAAADKAKSDKKP